MIEEPQVVIHKAQESDSFADFLHSDFLPGEGSAEIDLSSPEADPATLGDGDGSVVERVVQLAKPR